jgi:hypothetical protein
MVYMDAGFDAFAGHFEPGHRATVQALIRAEDYAGLAKLYDDDPYRQDLSLLSDCSVPIFASVAWNDLYMPVALTLDALEAMPATTPRRAFLTQRFDDHGTPFNERQEKQVDSFRDRWFARFLKGVPNDVEIEPRFVSGVLPESWGEYSNPQTLRWNRYHDVWPPPSTSSHRWHLRAGHRLTATPPATAESPDRIVHDVVPGYGFDQYFFEDLQDPVWVMRHIPLSTADFDSDPLPADVEIAGSAKVHLDVTSSGPNWQAHCKLYQLSQGAEERFLGSGLGLVRGGATGPTVLDVDLADLDAYLRAGDRLRLRVENLALRWTPDSVLYDFWVVPYFESTHYDVEHSSARPSWLEVPMRDVVQPALSCASLAAEVTDKTDIRFEIEGPASLAGKSYVVSFGASGITPPVDIPGSDPLRLKSDLVTLAFAALPSSVLKQAVGTLNSEAKAVVKLRLDQLDPTLVDLIGERLNAAAVVLDGSQVYATNPVDLFLR